MTLRTSWAVQDAIDEEDARVHMAASLMAGLRDASPYGDMPVARAGFRLGYGGTTPGRVTMTTTGCTVQPFQVVLPSQRGAVNGGAYIVTNDAVETIPLIINADASYSRIDRLLLVQNDTYYRDADGRAQIVQVQGTAASSPTPPPAPSGCDWFELARWTVPKNTTDLRTVTVTRLGAGEQGTDRSTVAAGGVLPVPNDAARNLLTAKGWAGLTVYNQKAGTTDPPGLEVLTGPGGRWDRQGAGGPVLSMVGNMTPAAQPVQSDRTMYLFGDDLYLWRAPGVWSRLTYNNIDDDWISLDMPSNATWPENWPVARKINAHVVQVTGLLYADGFKTANFADITLLARLPDGLRPKTTQVASVVCEFASDYTTNAKVEIAGGSGPVGGHPSGHLPGQIWFYRPAQLKARWVSLDGIMIYLDDGWA